MSITNEYTLQSKVVKALIAKGYPELSIRPGWKQSNIQYDLAIVEPKTGELLAVFEFKLESDIVISSTKLREKIKKYASIDVGATVPLFIITAVFGKDKYHIAKILYSTKDTGHPHFIETPEIPEYQKLRDAILGDKKKVTRDQLTAIVYVVAIVLSGLLLLEWFDVIVITPIRLALIGVIIGCLLIPHATRLKVLGFEFEKRNKTDNV